MKDEYKKLVDLEFEYNIARLSCQEEDVIRKAKGRYIRQLHKVIKNQSLESNNEEIHNKTQEEQGLFEIL